MTSLVSKRLRSGPSTRRRATALLLGVTLATGGAVVAAAPAAAVDCSTVPCIGPTPTMSTRSRSSR